MITVKHVVKRIDWRTYDYDCPRGSGYCRDQGTTQRLVKEFRLFGFKIWSQVIDKEEVPMYAVIDNAVLGYSSWVSKFAEYMRKDNV